MKALAKLVRNITGRSSLSSSTIHGWPAFGGKIAIGIMRLLPLSTMKPWQITGMKELLLEVDALEKQRDNVIANQIRLTMAGFVSKGGK